MRAIIDYTNVSPKVRAYAYYILSYAKNIIRVWYAYYIMLFQKANLDELNNRLLLYSILQS